MFEFENLGVRRSLATVFNHGALKDSGRIFIYAIDQGFEMGPAVAFSANPEAYDPLYHFRFAVETGASAIAGPLGFLQTGAPYFVGRIPMILKINNGNRLMNKERNAPYQAITASIQQALQLGCVGVGFTIYPGSDASIEMYSELQAIAEEAKAHGLFVIVWSYPRGNMKHERALDVIAYGAHIACLLGADIVKVKVPDAVIDHQHDAYAEIPFEKKSDRIKHVMDAAFLSQRAVLFSGEVLKGHDDLLSDIEAIREGGGTGSIIGRNLFQRPYDQAVVLAQNIIDILKQPSNIKKDKITKRITAKS